jgi:hypothetical protein
MLIAKIFVNTKQIDELHIQNTGHTDIEGSTLYAIKKPEIKNLIKHKRQDGYKPLLLKALQQLSKEGK